MKTTEICVLCLIAVVMSFVGFAIENIWLSLTKGYIDNRNMILPFLLGYGIAIIAVYFLFGTPQNFHFFGIDIHFKYSYLNSLLYYILMVVCVSAGEIALGTFVEKTCGIVWWDYSRLPYHLTKYTSLFTSMAFGMAITAVMSRIFEPLAEFFYTFSADDLIFYARTSMAALLVDFIVAAAKFYTNREAKPMWKIDTTNTLGYRLLHSENS